MFSLVLCQVENFRLAVAGFFGAQGVKSEFSVPNEYFATQRSGKRCSDTRKIIALQSTRVKRTKRLLLFLHRRLFPAARAQIAFGAYYIWNL